MPYNYHECYRKPKSHTNWGWNDPSSGDDDHPVDIPSGEEYGYYDLYQDAWWNSSPGSTFTATQKPTVGATGRVSFKVHWSIARRGWVKYTLVVYSRVYRPPANPTVYHHNISFNPEQIRPGQSSTGIMTVQTPPSGDVLFSLALHPYAWTGRLSTSSITLHPNGISDPFTVTADPRPSGAGGVIPVPMRGLGVYATAIDPGFANLNGYGSLLVITGY